MSAPVTLAGTFSNITGTGNVTGTDQWAGQLVGFYVNSTSSGTLVLKSGGSSGTAMAGTITPAIGFHSFPAIFKYPLHATVGGTIDVTFFYNVVA